MRKSWFLGSIVVTGIVLVSMPLVGLNAAVEPDPMTFASQAPTRSALLSNRYTQEETDTAVVDQNLFADLVDYLHFGTVGDFALYVKPSRLMFRVVDLRSNYLWASSMNYDYFLEDDSPLADPGDVGLNPFWRNKLDSPFILNYFSGVNIREENLFENAGSAWNFTGIVQPNRIGFHVDVSLRLSKIDFAFEVILDQAGLHFDIPFESIVEYGEAKLSSISLYPMFGATKRLRTPGYVAIPDGMGALIRFDDRPEKGVFTKRFFGPDPGINQSQGELPLNANMFGVVHGVKQHAMLGIVEGGSGNAILTHIGSQVVTDMNWTYVTFSYRTSYIQYLNQSKTSSVSLVQEDFNEFDGSILYQFLDGEEADYLGIAKRYGEYLFGDQTLTLQSSDIPLHLDVLALENKPGFFTRQNVVMTTVPQLQAMVASLTEEKDIEHLYLSYLGWNQGGYSLTAPNYKTLDGSLGSSMDVQSFSDFIAEKPIELYYGVNPFQGYRSGGGYTARDVVQTIGKELIYNHQYYELKPTVGTALYRAIRDSAISPSGQYALERIGSYLTSDYAPTVATRSASIAHLKTEIGAISNQAVYKPFSYFFNAEALFDLPMYSSQQGRFSDTVPLLATILQNRVHGFGRAGNFFSNTQNELLRLIDYNLYPSFYVTHESAYQLIDTESNHVFTSRFSDWSEEIDRQYDYVSGALNQVYGATLFERTVLAPGVVHLRYDNDTSLWINYSGTDYDHFGTILPAMDYEVTHGEL